VFPARGAELLDLELLGHGPLVLGRVVVGAAAIAARQFDDVAHESGAPERIGAGTLAIPPASVNNGDLFPE
jgi:hypothetical protein